MKNQTTADSLLTTAMGFRFEKLQVWQDSRSFAVRIYKITSIFPDDEKFGLTNQLRRASVSIALNIAEGSDKKSDKDFVRFLRVSIGSLEETVTGMFIALDLDYISALVFEKFYQDANKLASKINALINSLKKQ